MSSIFLTGGPVRHLKIQCGRQLCAINNSPALIVLAGKRSLSTMMPCQRRRSQTSRSHSRSRSSCRSTVTVMNTTSDFLIKCSTPLKFQSCSLADAKDVDKKIDEYRKGSYETIPDPSDLSHFKSSQHRETKPEKKASDDSGLLQEAPPVGKYVLPHPIWTEEQLNNVKITHKEPKGLVDRMAFGTVKLMRWGFDVFSGFAFGQRNEKKWLNRISFLETVAGVPGMVAAMLRHMRSLRRLQRDQNWIHTLLEEAENERMHLLTALQLKQPSLFFRLSVIGAQGVFVTMFGTVYIFSPKFCHRFVGYLEEEAVITYTKCLEDIDNGPMKHWQTQPAPEMAIRYWKLKEDATMRDVILVIRADEAHHRVVNHSLASLDKDEFNPYKPGQ